MDPYARQVTNSVGNGVVYDPAAFDWGDDDVPDAAAGTTSSSTRCTSGRSARRPDRPGTFDAARRRLRYLRELGVGAIQVMPPFEFAGDVSWGYNPAHLFAIESTYGGPDAFKRFVRDAHAHGIAVIVDVVYNHLGPSDLDLWRFDGWARGRQAAGSTSTTTTGRSRRRGAPRAPTTAAARSARSCATAR